MPRLKAKVEFVTVTRDGFRYRGRIHANTNNLLKWFKEHFRDPIPGVGMLLILLKNEFLFEVEKIIKCFCFHIF